MIFFCTNTDNSGRYALFIRQLYSSLSQAGINEQLFSLVVGEEPKTIFTHLHALRNRIVVFHFEGRAEHLESLVQSSNFHQVSEFLEYLIGCPNLRLIVLNYCGRPNYVDRLIELRFPGILVTSRGISYDVARNFTSTFYHQFLVSGSTAGNAYDQTISMLGISPSQVSQNYANFHGNRSIRRVWNLYNDGMRIIGNEDIDLTERLQMLQSEWRPVVDSGQAIALLAYNSTILTNSAGHTLEEIRREFARWGKNSVELVERLTSLSLLVRTENNGRWVYQSEAVLNDDIFQNLYTSHNNLARTRQILANLAYLPTRIIRVFVAIYNRVIGFTIGAWQWCRDHTVIVAGTSMALGSLLMTVLAFQGVVLKGQLRTDLSQYIGELSSPRVFVLSRKNVDDSFMERMMEWFTGFEPLRPSDINFQPLNSPLTSATARDLPWQRVVLSDNQSHLTAASNDGTIRIWPMHNLEAPSQIKLTENSIVDFAFDPLQNNLVYTDPQGIVHLRNLRTNEERLITNHGQGNTFVRFSNGGNLIISGGADSRISVYHIAMGSTETFMTASLLGITALDIDQTGHYIAYATEKDYVIYVWDNTIKQTIAILKGHLAEISSVEFHLSEQLLLSTSDDHTVRLWPINNFSQDKILVAQTDQIPQAHFLANSHLIVTTGDRGVIQLWDYINYKLLDTQRFSERGIASLATSRSSRALAVADWDGKIFFLECRNTTFSINAIMLTNASRTHHPH